LDTDTLMQLALEMVGFEEVPGDSAIYVPGSGIRRVMIGIDIGPAELLLATQLGYDCVIAHHPAGFVPDRFGVYHRHALQMTAFGVPSDEAERIVEARRAQISSATSTDNYDRAPSVARLLGMPFLNIHNPWDEMGRRRMQEVVDHHLAAHPEATAGAIAAALGAMPEFSAASTSIEVRAGSAEAPAGRTVVSHGAYTNGGYAVASAYFRYGAGTVICIHFPVDDAGRIRTERLGNLIVSGHTASDSIGITPYIAELRHRGIEVTAISGVLDV
jgi:putative NIF3 family GTP cyclohydrolase 1 type 2